MIRLSKDIISRRSIPKRPAALATPRVKVTRRTHRQEGTMQDNFKIPALRSWQHCTNERFQSDASHIPLDRITIGDTGSAQETSPQ